MIVPHHDPRLSWEGHISLEQTDDYTRPWRIPFAERTVFFPDLAARAATQAGVRLAFRSTSGRVAGRIVPLETNQLLDLCLDDQWVASVDLAGKETFSFENLPVTDKRVELWLPQRGDFALRELEIDDGADLRPAPDTRPRWMTYGSSITHCGSAASPTRTWPAIVARERGLNLTCLGYGGQCHLDVQVARFMRDRPAEFISICAGINVYGQGSLNARTFEPAVIGFVKILREKHPKTPILLISPIISPPRETATNGAGWTLNNYREAVASAAEKLRAAGDVHLQDLDGRLLFDKDLAHLMPDQLHPDAEGTEALAQNFLLHAAPRLFDPVDPS